MIGIDIRERLNLIREEKEKVQAELIAKRARLHEKKMLDPPRGTKTLEKNITKNEKCLADLESEETALAARLEAAALPLVVPSAATRSRNSVLSLLSEIIDRVLTNVVQSLSFLQWLTQVCVVLIDM